MTPHDAIELFSSKYDFSPALMKVAGAVLVKHVADLEARIDAANAATAAARDRSK